jgi:hypothetical protein
VPGWLASVAMLGIVALYLYSVGPGDYRFPAMWALGLLALASALLTLGCVRALALAERDRATRAEPKVSARHNRMMLAIAYSSACSLLALPTGLAGNDRAWHGLMDGDPRVVATTPSLVTEVRNPRGDWFARVDGYAEVDGTGFVFDDEEVEFDDDPSAVPYNKIELWVVFDPDDLGAGYLVTSDRDDAEGLIEYPFLALLPFVLLIIGVMWLVHHLLARPSRFERFGPYSKSSFAAINPVPWQVWIFVAAWGSLFYAMPFAYTLSVALSAGPYSNAHHEALDSGPIAGALILVGVAAFAMVVYHAGMDSWAGFRGSEQRRRERHARH